MADARELERAEPQPEAGEITASPESLTISAIERYAIAPKPLPLETVQSEYASALERAHSVCGCETTTEPDEARGNFDPYKYRRKGVIAYSVNIPYTTSDGTVLDMRICIRRLPQIPDSVRSPKDKPKYETVGLLIEDPQRGILNDGLPLVELSPDGLVAQPNESLVDSRGRKNQASDLQSLLNALDKFELNGFDDSTSD